MRVSAEEFLNFHKLTASHVDMDELVEAFTDDMNAGLAGRQGALRMIPTYIEADNDFLKDTPVLAIDAGGTNFRAALVTVSGTGRIKILNAVNHRMPGLDGEIGSRDFFSIIAGYLKPLADKAGRIGFCFSYPTEIMPDGDGRLIEFCKEVRAPEVHGQLIGKNLLEELGTPAKRIVLLNDTVATLLAGKSASPGRSWDSFIGFILGTGTNTCYIEKNYNILKNKHLDPNKSQIINIESGDFRRPPGTDLDILFDRMTANPGSYKFEKMFSGGYFGNLVLFMLKKASEEGVFSELTAGALEKIDEITTTEVNEFVSGEIKDNNVLGNALHDPADTKNFKQIINCLIDRAARLVAASLSSVVLITGKGREAGHPILITVEGTTFYRLHNFRNSFGKYFYEYLRGDRKRYVEFTEVKQSGLVGAALAALIE